MTQPTEQAEPAFARWFARGVEEGRKQVRDELVKLLDLDERIAKALEQHEMHYHGYEP